MRRTGAKTHTNQGGALPALLLLVLVLAGGGYNYWRNLQAEPPRPYEAYGDAELGQLIAAYEGEVSQPGASPPAANGRPGGSGTLLQQRVDDFEDAQRRGNAHREAMGQIAGQEGVLRQLRDEQQARAESPLALHLRRLTTI